MLRAVAVVVALVCVPALVAFVAYRGADGGEDGTEAMTPASPTAGGLMPWAIVSPTPAMWAGGIAGTIPAASATARPAAAPTATASATAAIPTLTPEERTEAEALLRAAALGPEDIPEGFPLGDEGFTTNEELAEVGRLSVEMFGSAGGATLEDPYSSGRILGYHANYDAEAPGDPSSFSGTASFGMDVDLFREASDAHQYVELVRQQLSNWDEMAASQERQQAQEYLESLGLEFRNVSVSTISFADVGDERIAFEMAATVHVSELGLDMEFEGQGVALRRGRVVAALTVLTINSSADEDQLEDLAHTLDERMKDALE